VSDGEFARALEACEISNADFHHRDHVRLAWFYLRSYGAEAADQRISAAIRNFAERHGKLDKYHHTMTIAWMRLVAPAAALASFDAVTAAFPRLLDKTYLREFYSDELLSSDAAKKTFVEPDKQPFSVVK
jgi:hypothetical protein